MKYRESVKDKKLRKWFVNDNSRTLLRGILLQSGELRGINSLKLNLSYPITVIAGRNGAGKSTILALACCAYHNHKDGFKLPKRTLPYYRFSDFFIQHTEEVPPQGIEIRYSFAHNKWKKSEKLPEGFGVGFQRRWKNQGGKWNDYADRLRKNVVFLGIERIVPHSERSQSRSYSKVFKDTKPKGWEDKVKKVVGYVLGRTYDNFRYLEYSKYALPIVQIGEIVYSGFNMGAGENALFEIFSTIYSCGDGALLVMDEVELGLHSEAQRKFMEKLKEVCLEMHTQVICTTHSREIFDCLPNEARFYVESVNGKTRVTDSISSDFAFSKLGATNAKELDIFVEDDVARSLLLATLPTTVRSRVTVKVIGSATALARQLAALYVRGEQRPILAIFDGDQKVKEADNIRHAKDMAEKVTIDLEDWLKARIAYFPGDTWPEAWIIQRGMESIELMAGLFTTDTDLLSDILGCGLQAGKHKEFYEIAKYLGLDRTQCLQLATAHIAQNFGEEFATLSEQVTAIIEENG